MTTILDVLEKGADFLAQKGISEPRLNMELLVADELGLKRMDLYLRFDNPINEQALSILREKLKKRSQNIPLQHLTKETHFHDLSLKVDRRALIPRPETEELVELVLGLKFPRPARILDMGCGSGALGLSIAKSLGTDCEQLLLADLSTEALSLAKENTETLGLATDFIESNLFSEISGSFDIIVANLPYITEGERSDLSPEVLHDPEMALFGGADGLDLIRPFCAACSDYLNPGGLVALEVGHQQGESVNKLLTESGLIDAALHSDLCGIPRFPLAWKASS